MNIPSAEFEHALAESRRMLERMRDGARRPADAPAEGIGEAADGRIRVIATTGNRIDRVELDPRVMRMASQDLAVELARAVIDAGTLARQVREIQDQGLRQMELINQSLAEITARFAARDGRS